MLIKSTKDLRNYQEVVYFGMNLRQLLFAGLALVSAAGVYFLLRGKLSNEVISWLCILAAAPFGAFGFVKWHGMNMEELILMWCRSWFCLNKTLYFRPQNGAKLLISDYLKEIRKDEGNAKNRKGRKSKTP